MGKLYTALGLMSGTSGDGVDVSVIDSDGIDQFNEVTNKYFKYDQKIYENLHNLRDIFDYFYLIVSIILVMLLYVFVL